MQLWKRFTQFILLNLFYGEEASLDNGQLAVDYTPSLSTSDLITFDATGSCNTPTNRQCWSKGFDIDTDYEKVIPQGTTKKFYLEVSNHYNAPDGYNISQMLFNGSYPGPLIEADWGDTLEITIFNNLTNHNGTSVHWHGIRQWNTTWYDGVSGITECPIPPKESFTYKWRATQYGVSWYHSHFSLQYPDGLIGPLKINGPTSDNYDIDLGPVLINDHFHKSAFTQVQLEYLGRPPKPDTMLMNGNGTYYCCSDCKDKSAYDPQCIGGSKITDFILEPGKKYKMSLVNSATATHMTYWIDGHNFTVVGTDFVPIGPYNTSILNIAIGQRYDIILTAKTKEELKKAQQVDFWIHARDCNYGGDRSNLGIIRYDASSNDIPYTPPPKSEHVCYGCLDELNTKLKPKVSRTVPPPANAEYNKNSERFKVHLVGYPEATNNASTLHKWVLKDSSLYLDWTQPSLSLLNYADKKDFRRTYFPRGYEPVDLDYESGQWVYFVIEGKFQDSLDESKKEIYKIQAPVAHPMHIHGHDFVVLASGTKEFDPKDVELNLNNPPRRDVALLPVDGYLVVAFEINNPGAWLMHCHIAWHASGGLALQFVEQPKKFAKLFRESGVRAKYAETCTNWGAYYSLFNKNENAMQEDSGI